MIRSANLLGSLSRKAGGLYESVRRLVQSLNQTGVDIHVLGLEDEFTSEDIGAWRPVGVSYFRPIWPARLGYSPGWLRELKAYAPDVTHTHGLWMFMSAATHRYCRESNTPYVVSPHGMLDHWAVWNSRWKKTIASFLYEDGHLRGARCLRALCEPEARAIRQHGLKQIIAIIPNGIDFPAGPPACGPPWQGLVEPGTKVILYLGRIHPKKGLVNLIRAWATVRRLVSRTPSSAQWVLAVAGWDQGGHEGDLKALATSLGIHWRDSRDTPTNPMSRTRSAPPGGEALPAPGQVYNGDAAPSLLFLGPQFNQAKAACFHHCDAFILPSLSEGLPMTVLEAWAYAKPVIMTRECNLSKAFVANAALRIQTGTESIAAGLNEFLTMNEADRTSLGARGYALAAEEFAWPRIASEMKEVYSWVLGGGPKPGCLADF